MKLTEYWRLRYRDPQMGKAAAPGPLGGKAELSRRTESVTRIRDEVRGKQQKDFEDTMPRVFHPELG